MNLLVLYINKENNLINNFCIICEKMFNLCTTIYLADIAHVVLLWYLKFKSFSKFLIFFNIVDVHKVRKPFL